MTVRRPHGMNEELEAGYRDMSRDAARERDAVEWLEGLVEDVANDVYRPLDGAGLPNRSR